MQTTVETDIAIIGGGIAGLWLLNRLRALGYATILLESNALGGGQTSKAQGIIHGGTKYALQGAMTPAAVAIAAMPATWQDCLKGKGEINLSNVPVLSHHQYLFSTNKLTGKLAGFFAGMALQGNLQEIKREAYPAVFQFPQFKGLVYALEEMAIDVQALIRELVMPHQDAIFKINPMKPEQLQIDDMKQLTSFEVQTALNHTLHIKAKKYIFTAGAGNEMLLQKLACKGLAMQRRPLHMVVAKTDFPYPVYAHCLGLSAVPRITITSHLAHDGKTVWYMGGQIAEEGVKYSSEEQVEIAKKELRDIFPWLDFSAARFASFIVDRAEPLQPSGKRPDSIYVKEIENIIIAWPTKLALAPKLADEIISYLQESDIQKGNSDTRALHGFPMPVIAKPIWDELIT